MEGSQQGDVARETGDEARQQKGKSVSRKNKGGRERRGGVRARRINFFVNVAELGSCVDRWGVEAIKVYPNFTH